MSFSSQNPKFQAPGATAPAGTKTLQSLELDSLAKLNLRLKIEGLREDGYHLLSMLNVTCSLHDSMKITYLEEGVTKVEVDGVSDSDRSTIIDLTDGPVARGITKFFSVFKVPGTVQVSITKRIPLGGGLAGGSSNVASVLRWLYLQVEEGKIESRLAKGRRESELLSVASSVGADVPFLIYGRPAWVRGIGDEIQPIPTNPFTGIACVLVCPNYGSSTSEIYNITRALWGQKGPTPDRIGRMFESELTYDSALGLIENDLMEPVFQTLPEVAKLFGALRQLEDSTVGMSGSGSTLFVLPSDPLEAAPSLLRRVQKILGSHHVSLHDTCLM